MKGFRRSWGTKGGRTGKPEEMDSGPGTARKKKPSAGAPSAQDNQARVIRLVHASAFKQPCGKAKRVNHAGPWPQWRPGVWQKQNARHVGQARRHRRHMPSGGNPCGLLWLWW